MKLLWSIAAVVILTATGSGFAFFLWQQPESTAVMSGAEIALTLHR